MNFEQWWAKFWNPSGRVMEAHEKWRAIARESWEAAHTAGAEEARASLLPKLAEVEAERDQLRMFEMLVVGEGCWERFVALENAVFGKPGPRAGDYPNLLNMFCQCGHTLKTQCPGEWEPGCDLGANESHAVPSKSEPPRKHALGALEETMSAESIARSNAIADEMRDEIDAAIRARGETPAPLTNYDDGL